MENVYALPAFQKGTESMTLLLYSLMCTIKSLAWIPVEVENRHSGPVVPVRCGNIYHSEDLLIVGRQ